MSVLAHKSQVEPGVKAPVPRPALRVVPPMRREPVRRPPTRPARSLGVSAPRVLARVGCVPRAPKLAAGWVLAVAAVACGVVFGLGSLAGAAAPSVPSETTVVRVKPGESLWELAGRVAPGADASAVVERIRELNGVEGSVQPGQPLTVPAG